MDRRETYRLVSGLLPGAGGAMGLLDRAADVMRGASRWKELEASLQADDALGHLYQAINAPALEAAYRATARDRRKFTAKEIPAVTQLFTPKWVVEFLLQNTLGRLWLEQNPASGLQSNWKWLAKTGPAQEGNPLSPNDIRICDPACGTMNFGLVAVDLLRDMYRESGTLAEIDSSIVRNNLVGFDIDPTAIDLARRSLEIKVGRSIPECEHQLSVRDALFQKWDGELFDVVVTNPPYLSARNLDPKVVRRLKARFPSAWRDLYACFLLRALELLKPGGFAGILTMHSFMFTAAFERMRRELHEMANVEVVAHFGPGLFDIGNPGTLQTAAIVLRKKPCPQTQAVFFRLVDAQDKSAALQLSLNQPNSSDPSSPTSPDSSEVSGFVSFCKVRHEVDSHDFAASPRGAWMYWISPEVRRAFVELPKLGQIAPPRQGLATTDNARFVRYWWEVERPGHCAARPKWMPYAKGGRFRRWYEAARHRVNWEDDGREIKQAIVDRYPYLNGQWQWVAKNSAWYGREGITYSYLTSGSFNARKLEAGTIFDVAGSSLFPQDSLAILAVLNSRACREFLAAINPTVNFQVGDLRQLPVPAAFPDELRIEAASAIECMRRLETFDETSVDFIRPEKWEGRESVELLETVSAAERRIDAIVSELYGMSAGENVECKTEERDAKAELARRWISYALGIWLGRWGGSKMEEVAMLLPLDPRLCTDIHRILAERTGECFAAEIIAAAGGLDRFFARDFLPWHSQMYRGRPVFWGFSGDSRIAIVSAVDADQSVMREAFAAIGQTLPPGWQRWVDDGILVNLAPLREWIAERKLRDSLAEVDADLREGRLGFSQTSKWMDAIKRESNGGCDPIPRRTRRPKVPASRGR